LIDPDQRAVGICPVFHAHFREAVRPRLSLILAATARGLYRERREPAKLPQNTTGHDPQSGYRFLGIMPKQSGQGVL